MNSYEIDDLLLDPLVLYLYKTKSGATLDHPNTDVRVYKVKKKKKVKRFL